MQRFNSTIRQKKCKCSGDCDKYPTMGFGGYFYAHAPEELRNKGFGSKKTTKSPKRSDLLKVADIAFGRFIKKRDADKNGITVCPCCNKSHHLKDKTPDGETIIQTLHFIKRGNFETRYDERLVYAGCCYCNQKMHFNPVGKEYQAFRRFLVDRYGEDAVRDAELSIRKIIPFKNADIEAVIDKYK